MANRYRLKLAGKEDKAKIFGTEVLLREMELTMLENIFYVAANTYKTAKDIHLCLDFADQVKNIGDATEIILDDCDKKNLEAGIEATEKNRPIHWYASSLWRQFDKLVPIME